MKKTLALNFVPIPERPPLHIPRWLWNAIMGLLGLTMLAACGGSNPSPQPPPVNPPWRGSIGSNSPWAITQGSYPGALANGALDFRPGDPASTYLSYAEVPLQVSILGASSYALTYTFTGDPSTFLCTSCAAGTPVTARLLLHQQGDDMSAAPCSPTAYRRWFSSAVTPLAAGANTITAGIGDLAQWTPVYKCNAAMDGQGFINALQHLGSVGICFGGGDFACHGVAGTGHLQIEGAVIQ